LSVFLFYAKGPPPPSLRATPAGGGYLPSLRDGIGFIPRGWMSWAFKYLVIVGAGNTQAGKRCV
jgi:hypothetical protein